MIADVDLPGCPRLLKFAETDSTNRVARRLADEGAADGTVVWAERQTAGRGRHGRQWQSPAGNLYVSVILRPVVQASAIGAASFVAALAVADAVCAMGIDPARVRCKWPNDVLIDGLKTAGILMESELDGHGGLAWIVAGVGLNLDWHPPAKECLYPPTSLAAAGGSVEAGLALQALWAALIHWLAVWREQGFAPVRRAWLNRAYALGEMLSVRLGDGTLSGVFTRIEDDGALILATEQGSRRVIAGDVFPAVAPVTQQG